MVVGCCLLIVGCCVLLVACESLRSLCEISISQCASGGFFSHIEATKSREIVNPRYFFDSIFVESSLQLCRFLSNHKSRNHYVRGSGERRFTVNLGQRNYFRGGRGRLFAASKNVSMLHSAYSD